MSEPLSERRMAENEVFFRQQNEEMQKSIEAFTAMAKQDGHDDLLDNDDTPLHFYCECSDENCRKRIELQPSKYDKIHKKRNRFLIICGHEAPSVEQVVERKDGFCVVEKLVPPPPLAPRLQPTPVDNS